MNKYGRRSKERLATTHFKLQEIANELIKLMDVTVLCGHRGEDEQNKAFNKGNSKLQFPKSKHNVFPSLAIDLAPYPVDWNDIESFEYMCGLIQGIAHMKGIKIRLGKDFSFRDYPHIELAKDEV